MRSNMPWAAGMLTLRVSGLQARRLSLRWAVQHLDSGYDVVIGQYLARMSFIESLERTAEQAGAQFAHMWKRQADLAPL